MSVGTVFWITGLPRSGKTTLANALCERLRSQNRAVVALDGDTFREACGGDLGYDEASRLQNAKRLSGMCRLISSQGFIVVCSTVSLIAEIHDLNRSTLARYVEVLVRVPNETLKRRDPELYGAAARGEIPLPGVNQSFSLPPRPEIVFEAFDAELELDSAVNKILELLESPDLRA